MFWHQKCVEHVSKALSQEGKDEFGKNKKQRRTTNNVGLWVRLKISSMICKK